VPSDNLIVAILEARRALKTHTDVDLARFLGISRRTVQRHGHSGGVPTGPDMQKFVRALHPVDPASARHLATAFRVDIRDLETKAAPKANEDHVLRLVLAAADATNMVPRDVRPALAVIFGAALELGVDLNELAGLLAPAKKPASKRDTSP
jgi:hypothetical protein